MRDLSNLIDKFNNKKIEGITDSEQMQIFNALKDLEMYQRVGTIAEFMELKWNKKRPVEHAEWIYCGDGKNMPEEHENKYYLDLKETLSNCVLVTEIFRNVERIIKKVTIAHTFNGEWVFPNGVRCEVIAWQPLPEPYHGL